MYSAKEKFKDSVCYAYAHANIRTYIRSEKKHTYIYIYIYFSLHSTLTFVKLKYIKIVYKVLPKLQIVNKLSKEF